MAKLGLSVAKPALKRVFEVCMARSAEFARWRAGGTCRKAAIFFPKPAFKTFEHLLSKMYVFSCAPAAKKRPLINVHALMMIPACLFLKVEPKYYYHCSGMLP